jgi:hypothetical protein
MIDCPFCNHPNIEYYNKSITIPKDVLSVVPHGDIIRCCDIGIGESIESISFDPMSGHFLCNIRKDMIKCALCGGTFYLSRVGVTSVIKTSMADDSSMSASVAGRDCTTVRITSCDSKFLSSIGIKEDPNADHV